VRAARKQKVFPVFSGECIETHAGAVSEACRNASATRFGSPLLRGALEPQRGCFVLRVRQERLDARIEVILGHELRIPAHPAIERLELPSAQSRRADVRSAPSKRAKE